MREKVTARQQWLVLLEMVKHPRMTWAMFCDPEYWRILRQVWRELGEQ